AGGQGAGRRQSTGDTPPDWCPGPPRHGAVGTVGAKPRTVCNGRVDAASGSVGSPDNAVTSSRQVGGPGSIGGTAATGGPGRTGDPGSCAAQPASGSRCGTGGGGQFHRRPQCLEQPAQRAAGGVFSPG